MTKLTGEQIREGRTAKKMTLRALAKELGVTAVHLSYVEHCRHVLTDEQYAKAQEILGVKPRVSERACLGYGGTYEQAIDAALSARRDNGFHDTDIPNCRLVVDQHYIEPWLNYDHLSRPKYGFRHVVVLRRLR